MSALKNYAGCKHCVEEEVLTREDKGAGHRFMLGVFFLLYMCVFAIFSLDIQGGNAHVDFSENIPLTVVFVLAGIISIWIYASRADKHSLYLYYDQNGQMHAHRFNPISEQTVRSAWIKHGPKWFPNPDMSSNVKHISGVVIRLRWNGWLFRLSGYNKIFENRTGGGLNWRVDNDESTHNGPTYTIGNHIADQQKIIVTLSQLLEIANGFGNLEDWKNFHMTAANDRQLFGETVVAVIRYIASTKSRGASKVGTRARLLLKAGFDRTASLMDNSFYAWKDRAPEVLAELEQILEAEDQNEVAGETPTVSA